MRHVFAGGIRDKANVMEALSRNLSAKCGLITTYSYSAKISSIVNLIP